MVTIKQKKLAKITSDMIVGTKPATTMKAILLEAGYTLKTALQQQVVLESKGYLEELERYVPNDMLTKIGLEALTAEKVNNFGQVVTDWSAIHKFWRDFQLMKGNLKNNDNTLNVQVNSFNQLTEEQLKDLINKAEKLT